MRILIVLTYYVPYVSGVTEFARMLAEYLGKDHDVTVLATQHEPGLPREELIAGVRVIRSPVALRLHKGVISPRFVKDFRRLAREADVVNMHLPMLEAGLLALLCNPARLVTMYQCDLAVTGGLVDRIAVLAARFSARLALARSARVTVTTLDYAYSSVIARRARTRLVEVRAPLKQPPARDDGMSTSHAGGPLRIGFVGRFVKEKGLPILLDAFERALAASNEDMQLVLVGQAEGVAGGSVIDDIGRSIDALGAAVEVTGKVSEEQLWRLYESFDLLVLPSVNRYEAFGMVQIEAMMAGALVVASDLPGVRTIVTNTGCGCVARVGDAERLAGAIVEAAAMRKQLTRTQVRERVLMAYPPTASLELQANLFRAVADVAAESERH